MLKGKTAVVTGGVRGIGKAIAKIFCENGANVVLCYRSNDAEAEKTAAELGAFGTQVRVVKGDVADPETAKKVAELIKTDFDKKVDILVNNAGITNDKLMMRMDAEDFTKVINANLNGAFYMMKELSALMVKKRSGVIINMGVSFGTQGQPCTGELQRIESRSCRHDAFRSERARKTRHKSECDRTGIHRNRYDSSAHR